MAAVASSNVRFLPVQMFVSGCSDHEFYSVAMYFQYTGNEKALQRVVDAFASKHGVFDTIYAPPIILPTTITDEVLASEEVVQHALRTNRNMLKSLNEGRKHTTCCDHRTYIENYHSVRVVRGHLSLFDEPTLFGETSPFSPENAAKDPFYDLYEASPLKEVRESVETILTQCVFYCFGRWTADGDTPIVEATSPPWEPSRVRLSKLYLYERQLTNQQQNGEFVWSNIAVDAVSTRGKPSGISESVPVSSELANFLGFSGPAFPVGIKISKVDATRLIHDYIKKNNLKDPEHSRMIRADEPLAKLLRLTPADNLSFFNLQRYLSPHFPRSFAPKVASAVEVEAVAEA
jgi:SWIB/MDM2 domain